MFKSIKNIINAVADITVIGAKETCHQISSANDCCTDVTRIVKWKTGQIRSNYEGRLAKRQRKMLVLDYVPEEQIK